MHRWLFIVLIISILALAGCDKQPGGAIPNPAKQTPTANLNGVPETAATPERSAESTSSPHGTDPLPTPARTPLFDQTPLPTSTPDPNAPAFDADGYSKLASYKSKLSITTEIGAEVAEQLDVTTEQTANPRAQIVTSIGTVNGEAGQSVTVIINNKQWINTAGEWLTTDLTDDEAVQMMSELSAPAFALIYPGLSSEQFVFLADETLNGIPVRHYGLLLQPEQAIGVAGDFDEVTTSQAEVWLSSAGNLPALAVKFVLYMEGTAQGQPARMNLAEEVTEVNKSITIAEPKPEADLPAGLPLYPGAEEFQPSGDFASFVVNAPRADVVQFYANALTADGWTELDTEELSGLLMETWTKGYQTAQLTYTTREDGKIEVGIYVEVLEP